MSRNNLRTIGFVMIIVLIAALIVFWSDIQAVTSEAMMEQTDSLVNPKSRNILTQNKTDLLYHYCRARYYVV